MTSRSHEEGFVTTYTGGRFYPFDPDPKDIDLEDIANGLARICRFTGHCRHFYSVGQHSILVSRELEAYEPRIQLYGLLHDAAEAYLGDLPRPIKVRFEAFERIEGRILEAIWEAFDVPSPTEDEWETVMRADDRLLAYEAKEILADGSWAEESPDLGYTLQSESVSTDRDRFRSCTADLLEKF